MSPTTIEDLISKVSPGKTERFTNELPPADDSRFMMMFGSVEYKSERLQWSEAVEMTETPNAGSRYLKRRGFEIFDRVGLVFYGPSVEVVDFYSRGAGLYILSERLAEIIVDLDHSALITRSVSIVTQDAEMRMVAMLPARVISAVDVARTEIVVESKVWSEDFVQTLVHFPNGASLTEYVPEEVHVFRDADTFRTYWSKHLIEQCQAFGVRGLWAENAITNNPEDTIRL